jgi:hypothetical protein
MMQDTETGVVEMGATKALETWSLVVAFALSSVSIDADVRAEDPLTAKEPQKIMIKLLATSNGAPQLQGMKKPIYPENWDAKEVARIVRRIEQLCESFQTAAPALAEQLNDKSYCVTIKSPFGSHHNLEVGVVCSLLIVKNIAVYEKMCRVQTLRAIDGFPRKPSEVKAWWDKNKSRPLWQLQVEWLQWAIENERMQGFENKGEEEQILGPMKEAVRVIQESKSMFRIDCRFARLFPRE